MVARDLKSLVSGVSSLFFWLARRADDGCMDETRAPYGRTKNKKEWQG